MPEAPGDAPIYFDSLKVIATNAGKAAMFDAETAGLKLSITHMVVGSAGYVPSAAQISLTAEKMRVPIASSTLDAATGQLQLNAVLDSADEFWVREVGFLNEHGTLIWVWSSPANDGHLGYKSAIARFLLGVSIKLENAPLETIEIIDQGQPLELAFEPIREVLLVMATEQSRSALFQINQVLNAL
jgi:hypothetical protein